MNLILVHKIMIGASIAGSLVFALYSLGVAKNVAGGGIAIVLAILLSAYLRHFIKKHGEN